MNEHLTGAGVSSAGFDDGHGRGRAQLRSPRTARPTSASSTGTASRWGRPRYSCPTRGEGVGAARPPGAAGRGLNRT